MMLLDIFRPNGVLYDKYFVATYEVSSATNLLEAAYNIAVGQSIGNPNMRNAMETDYVVNNHACMILHDPENLKARKEGTVFIAYPKANINFNEDGVSLLICQVMGGQMDIDIIQKCVLLELDGVDSYQAPRYGITGIREYLGAYNRPLVGAIIKPKIGLTPKQLLEVVTEMYEGGADFIKEDEIMSNPAICPLKERIEFIGPYLEGKKVIYASSVTSDFPYLVQRVLTVLGAGGNCVHLNIWSGLGTYKAVRQLNLPLFLFFQKSGDKVITDASHRFSISWNVICQLAGMMGVDFIHAGMWGGYMSTSELELLQTLKTLHSYNVMPSLSCGMKPELVEPITNICGIDYMATSGGWIASHPGGIGKGVAAMRKAVESVQRS